MWQVVGGEDKGGILVRDGESTSSTQLEPRLSTGAWLEELELKGDRLKYKRVTGVGPETGWISTRISNGKDLAVKKTGERGKVPGELGDLRSVPPLPRSRWIAKYRHTGESRCRLIATFGAGSDASSFEHWNDYVSKNFPVIELVLLEHPGHGANRAGPPVADAGALADQIVEEYLNLESSAVESANTDSTAVDPVAILGFSVGATLGHAIVSRFVARGVSVLRFYACGRGSPAIKYHNKQEEVALMGTDIDYLRWFVKMFTGKETQQKMEKTLESIREGNEMIAHLNKKAITDLDMGNSTTPNDNKCLSCSIHVVASSGDMIWPAGATSSVVGELAGAWHPPYEDIVDTWRAYSDKEVTSTILDGLEHHELCGLLLVDVVCENLQTLLTHGL